MSKREDKSIAANLKRHAELMAELMLLGMGREAASKAAFKALTEARAALAKVHG